jgi:hypothetical protein
VYSRTTWYVPSFSINFIPRGISATAAVLSADFVVELCVFVVES